jgi:Cu/Ag efflux protein CusF
MTRQVALSTLVTTILLFVGCLGYCEAVRAEVSASGRHHAVAGELEKVDADAKKITIRAADGTEHAFSYGRRTVVHGVEATAKGAELAGREGSQVVVRYSGAAGRETADHIDVFGHDALKTTEGTITEVDKAGQKVVVRTSDGADETYDLGRDSAIDTEHGLVDAARFTGKEGDHVVVYHTEDAGRKVVHLLKRL